MQTALRWK